MKLSLNIFGKASRMIIWILFLAAVTGLLIDFILFEMLAIERHSTRFQMFGFALFYTLVFIGYDFLSHAILKRFSDGLHSIKDVLFHVIVQSSGMILAFLTATITLDSLNLFQFGTFMILDFNNPVLWVIAGVSFGAAFIGTSLYYGAAFYHQLKDAEKLALESQYSMLKAQVNPHFLFNSLNSISSLIQTNPEKAEEVTQDLADLFRYSLQSSKSEFVTVSQECAAVKKYMRIEEARFGKKIRFSSTVAENATNVLIPGFIIQPLVENAVKHGASETFETCSIDVDVSIHNSKLRIVVSDTGPGFKTLDKDTLFSKGTGLGNIQDRLRSMYRDHAEMIIQKNSVTLELPLKYQTE